MPEKISPDGQPPSAAALEHQARAFVSKGKPFRTEKNWDKMTECPSPKNYHLTFGTRAE